MKQRVQQLMERIHHFFYVKGLQFTLFSTFTLVSFLAIVLITAGYLRQFSAVTEQQIRENQEEMLGQVNLNLDDFLHRLMGVSNTAYYKIFKEIDVLNQKTAATRELDVLYFANETIVTSISLFDQEGKLLLTSPKNQLKENVDPTKQSWFQMANEQIENVHFSTPHVDNLFTPIQSTYPWVVSISRSVEYLAQGSVQRGVLLVNMNFTGIEKISMSANLGDGGYLYLMTSSGQLIYHPKQQLIYSGLLLENFHRATSYTEGSHQEIFQQEKRLVTLKTMGYTGWKVVGVRPLAPLQASVLNNHLLLWGVALTISLFLLGINLLISSRVTDPLRELEQSVFRLEQDLYDLDIPVSGTYEIQHLAKTLTTMAQKTQQLMQDIVEQQESMREKEMNVLQQQINPHFLYNTLDSTIWMIESGRYEGAITMITALATFFRISLSKGRTIISLEDELRHVESYLTIQEIRYKNKFEYSITVDESIKDATTIKLIIQPLVENAIYHGMDYMYEEGEIQIRAYRVDESVYIDIEDNGPGMTPEQMLRLRTQNMNSRNGRGSGIGFTNVEERIKLFYGKQYGLEVFSEPDEGTIIRIHLPFKILAEEESR